MTPHPTTAHAVRAALATRWRHCATGPSVRLAAGGLVTLLLVPPVWSAGLGEIRVQSALGQPLRANVALLGDDAGGKLGTCFSARLTTPDGAFIVAPRIALSAANAGGSGVLNLSTVAAMVEPAVTLVVEMGCGDALRKEFSLLLDPPMYLPGSVSTETVVPERQAGLPGTARSVTRPTTSGARRRATDAADAANARIAGSANSVVRTAPAPRAAPARPAQQKTSAAAPALIAPPSRPAGARAATAPSKNVLRLGARNGADVDLVNAVGLRLALADRLADEAAARGTTQAGTPIPDLAKSAANRAAQARFAAALRDQPDTAGDAALQATESKLAALQAKMQLLEAQAERMRQPGTPNPAVAGAAGTTGTVKSEASSADATAINWLPILAGVLGFALLVIGWLLLRMRRLQHDHVHWDWEENVSAADARAGDIGFEQARAVDDVGIDTMADPVASRQAPLGAGMGDHATKHPEGASSASGGHVAQGMQSAQARPAQPPKPRAPIFSPGDTPLEFSLDEPMISPPKSADAVAAAAAAGLVAGAVTGDGGASRATGTADALQFAEMRPQQPAVEEISDAMQEAEFWISLHDSQRAVEVLEPYATGDQPGSPLPWLYLFDLYRELNQRLKYDRLYERFQHIFNGKIQTWAELDQSPATVPARSLDDMPHVLHKISTLWHSENIVPYLESLLLDDRDGTRIGFDLPVYREIMFLIGMAYELQQSKKFIKPAVGTPGWTLAA